MSWVIGALAVASMIVASGCSCGDPQSMPDAGETDADAGATADAGEADAGAMVDAGPTPAARPSRAEIVAASGRLRGGSLVMDVVLGHPHEQRPSSNGAARIDPLPAIQP